MLNIAKEITIAAIDKGLIKHPNISLGATEDKYKEHNQKVAEEISRFYKRVAKTVYECHNKEFNVE